MTANVITGIHTDAILANVAEPTPEDVRAKIVALADAFRVLERASPTMANKALTYFYDKYVTGTYKEPYAR
jgi:hypothetical protein